MELTNIRAVAKLPSSRAFEESPLSRFFALLIALSHS